jgi:phosphatidylglycerophosphate synthase
MNQAPATPPSPLARLWPNLLTACRLPLAFGLWLTLSDGRFGTAFWLMALAFALDGADGLMARRNATVSRFGMAFDAVADSSVRFAGLIGLAWQGLVPVLIVGAAGLAELCIAMDALAERRRTVPPSSGMTAALIRKLGALFSARRLNGLAQGLALILFLFIYGAGAGLDAYENPALALVALSAFIVIIVKARLIIGRWRNAAADHGESP